MRHGPVWDSDCMITLNKYKTVSLYSTALWFSSFNFCISPSASCVLFSCQFILYIFQSHVLRLLVIHVLTFKKNQVWQTQDSSRNDSADFSLFILSHSLPDLLTHTLSDPFLFTASTAYIVIIVNLTKLCSLCLHVQILGSITDGKFKCTALLYGPV